MQRDQLGEGAIAISQTQDDSGMDQDSRRGGGDNGQNMGEPARLVDRLDVGYKGNDCRVKNFGPE